MHCNSVGDACWLAGGVVLRYVLCWRCVGGRETTEADDDALSEDEAELRHSKRAHHFHCSGTGDEVVDVVVSDGWLFIRQNASEHCETGGGSSGLVGSAGYDDDDDDDSVCHWSN